MQKLETNPRCPWSSLTAGGKGHVVGMHPLITLSGLDSRPTRKSLFAPPFPSWVDHSIFEQANEEVLDAGRV